MLAPPKTFVILVQNVVFDTRSINCGVTLSLAHPILLKMSARTTLRKNTRFPWGTLHSGLPRRKDTKKFTQEVPSLVAGSSDCSLSHRTRKASAALHRTKKIGLYFRGVSHFSAA